MALRELLTHIADEEAAQRMPGLAARLTKIGQERGNAEEKAFSTQMIADHTKTSEELKTMVAKVKFAITHEETRFQLKP